MCFETDDEIEGVARAMIACTLPQAVWMHAAHFAAALWLLRDHSEAAYAEIPGLIRAYEASVGGRHTDTEGYHETITQASLHMAARVRGTRRCMWRWPSWWRGRAGSRTGFFCVLVTGCAAVARGKVRLDPARSRAMAGGLEARQRLSIARRPVAGKSVKTPVAPDAMAARISSSGACAQAGRSSSRKVQAWTSRPSALASAA